MRVKHYLLAILSAPLSGCALMSHTVTLNGAPLEPRSKVITVDTTRDASWHFVNGWSTSDPYNPYAELTIRHKWHIWISSINGKRISKKTSEIQLSPGVYKVSYVCHGRLTITQSPPHVDHGTVVFDFTQRNVGHEYYPVGTAYVGPVVSYSSLSGYRVYRTCGFIGLEVRNFEGRDPKGPIMSPVRRLGDTPPG